MKYIKIIFIASILIVVFSASAFMNLFSGFTVEREVILSPDKYNTPSALLKAADDGYFVLGAIDEAWITKTDAIGNAIWTFQKQSLDETKLRFKAAAPSTDGGVLICGERNLGGVPRRTTGLLILLDKNGKEISRLDSYKQNPDQGGSFFSITSCSSWGSNFAISGAARISERESNGMMVTHETPTLMKIKGDGSLMWQMNVDINFQRFQAMPDGGLVLFGDGVKDEVGITAVMKVDSSGSIQASESLDPSCRLLARTTISSSLRFICNAGVPNKPFNLLELDQYLKLVHHNEYPSIGGMGTHQSYALTDGTVALFGYRPGFKPNLLLIGTNGDRLSEYEFHGSNEMWLVDGIPSGLPGEYVVVRSVQSSNGAGAMTKAGMTFLRHN